MSETISTLNDFLNQLEGQDAAQLVFKSQGEAIKPDYHVTELKSSVVKSIDCGANQSDWSETTVQLLDGSQLGRGEHMTVQKFVQIARASLQVIPDLAVGDLWFEYAPGNGPIRKLSISAMSVHPDEVHVMLGGVAAACKPFQKSQNCGSSSANSACCAA